jgi:hypothetical protein
MKSWILASYCLIGKITSEFPLSARAIMASLWLSLACMDWMVLVLGCVFSSVQELLFCRRVLMRSAASFLYISRSDGGRSCDIAVSVANARFCIQSFFLVWRLYFGPFYSSAISWSVNVISVLLITLGWKSRFERGVTVCSCTNLLSLLSSLRYLDWASFWSLFSIVCWMCCHRLFQLLARVRCRW